MVALVENSKIAGMTEISKSALQNINAIVKL